MRLIQLTADTGVQYVTLPPITQGMMRDFKPRFVLDRNRRRWQESADGDAGDDASSDCIRTKCRNVQEILEKGVLRENCAWTVDRLMPIPVGGGRLWCALSVRPGAQREDGEKVFELLMAIDTDVAIKADDDGIDSVSLNCELRIEPDDGEFWEHPVTRAFHEAVLRSGGVGDKPVRSAELVAEVEHYTLVQFLAHLQREKGLLPGLKVSARVDQGQCRPVDLVVDLGNSRTCAILTEPPAQGINSPPLQWKLRMRQPDNPWPVEEMPCTSTLAFVPRVPFELGDPVVLERLTTFRNVSPVAFGRAAQDALARSEGELTRRGLSSPKRYIWDARTRVQPWIEAVTHFARAAQVASPVLRHHIDKQVPWKRPAGGPRKKGDGAVTPDHPRCSLLTLVLLELLSQAYREANSVDYLPRQDDHAVRRRIANVIVMAPAGMCSEERVRFRALVQRAVEIWRDFRANPAAFFAGDVNPRPLSDAGWARDDARPQVEIACDEAMAIQACFVYAEGERLYSGLAQRMAEDIGRERWREDGEKVASMRVASIDIGGGTIDVAVSDFTPVGPDRRSEFVVQQHFRDGYVSAGDDLIRNLLESVIFPSLRKQLKIKIDQWNAALSHPTREAELVGMRRALVDQLWRPIAYQVINHFELTSTEDFRRPLADLMGALGLRMHTSRDLAKALGVPEAALLGCNIEVEAEGFEGAAELTWSPNLRLACSVVGEYKCDVLLIGGRFSTFPHLLKLLTAAAPVAPDRIRPLGDLEVNPWYPFGKNGRVFDAKTAAVVGCAVLHRGRIAQLNMQFEEAPFVHKQQFMVDWVQSSGDAGDEASVDLFQSKAGGGEPEQESILLRSRGEVRWVAVRRVSHPAAPARPIYKIGLAPALEHRISQFSKPQTGIVAFTVRRGASPEAKNGLPEIEGTMPPAQCSDCLAATIEVKDGALQWLSGPDRPAADWDQGPPLVVQLQTLPEETYWLDEGRFRPLEAEEFEPS